MFTLGYGEEHDSEMLTGVAKAGNGLFYYVDNEESIPESFCDCLGGLLSVAAQVGWNITCRSHAGHMIFTLCRISLLH